MYRCMEWEKQLMCPVFCVFPLHSSFCQPFNYIYLSSFQQKIANGHLYLKGESLKVTIFSPKNKVFADHVDLAEMLVLRQ